MKKQLVFIVAIVHFFCFSEESVSFVTKKITGEKSSHIKQDIAEIFESMLTQSCDMIVSIAQQQRLIVQNLKNLMETKGTVAEKNLQDLKKCREILRQIKEENNRQIVILEQHIKMLEKIL